MRRESEGERRNFFPLDFECPGGAGSVDSCRRAAASLQMSEPNREGAEGAGQPSDDDDFAAALEACMASDEDDEAEEGEDLLTTLPDDCLLRILRFLPHASLLTTALRSVNKRFGDAVAAEGVSRTRDRLKQSLEAGFAADIRRSEGGGGGSSSSSAAGSSGGGGSSSDVDMTPPPPPPAPPHGRLDELASALELALRTCGGATFRLKFRPLVFNLGDPKNPQLRRKLLDGALSPSAMLQLTASDMASSALQRQRSEWREKRKRDCVRERPVKGFVTDLYRCDRCDCTRAAVHRAIRAGQKQVDRARTYATCTDCSHRWEV